MRNKKPNDINDSFILHLLFTYEYKSSLQLFETFSKVHTFYIFILNQRDQYKGKLYDHIELEYYGNKCSTFRSLERVPPNHCTGRLTKRLT